jgi:hypothetical protein
MEKKRGQLTVEFLVMLAVLLVILVSFIYISQTSESGVRQTKVDNEALNTVRDLSAAAKEIYAQGAGAKKQVYITIPQGYEPEHSFVANRSIKIRVAGTDYIEVERFDVFGTLPASAGGHYVLVESVGSGVRIGYAMLEIDKSAIVVSMDPGESKTATMRIRNIWHKAINITISETLDDSIDFSITPSQIELLPSEERTIILSLKSHLSSVGLFPGEVKISSVSGASNEQIRVPITAVVKGMDYGPDKRKIRIVPQEMIETVERNISIIRSITVCTDQHSSFDEIKLEKSGNITSWINVTDSIGPFSKGECIEVLINITTPENVALGTYQSVINFSSGIYHELFEIKLTVGGDLGDVVGPSIIDIFTSDGLYANYPITFFAKAYDSGSRIKGCSIKIDSGEWTNMHVSDGKFDESLEDVSLTYADGLSFGEHVAYIRCTDGNGNVGEIGNHSFRLINELIFVQSEITMSESEEDWHEWIGIYESGLGFSWDHDVVLANELINVNLEDYALVVMAQYADTPLLDLKINRHLDEGGYVLLLGEANQEGVYALCQTNEEVAPSPEKSVYIYLNDHYITSDYSRGNLQIFPIDTKLYRIEADYVGAPIIVDKNNAQFTVLGDNRGIVSWGVASPFRFNENGIDITTRIIDYSIISSSKNSN